MYQKSKRSWLKHLDFTLLDLLGMELALVISYLIRFRGFDEWNMQMGPIPGMQMVMGSVYVGDLYIRMAIIIAFIDVVVVFFTEAYSGILRRNKYQEFSKTVIHVGVVFAVFLSYIYMTQQSFYYSRQLLIYFLGLSVVFDYGFRVVRKRQIRASKLQDKNKNLMIVIAERANVERCLTEIAASPYANYKVIGTCVVDEPMEGMEIQGIPVIANADNFLEYVRTNVVDEVYIDGNTRASSEALARTLVEIGITVHIALLHTGQMMNNNTIENYGNYVVMTSSMNIAGYRELFFKRLLDIIGAIVGLILCGIACIIFGPIIKHQSPGPIFFAQTRIGKNGRHFKFYKFRSMYMDAEERKAELMKNNEMDGLMFKMENDPRIIPIGHFMRKYSIDELPQFWNILKGDMSLVGTRPPTEGEYEQYEYHHKARLAFRPGLTGMWQVSGRSDITDFEEVVALDTEYIQNWTFGLDVKIILKTIKVVLTGEGSK